MQNSIIGQFKARTIRESREFSSQKELIQPDARKLDRQLFAVSWALSRNPELFLRVSNTKLHCVKTDPWDNAPKLRIYYTYNDDFVDLLWIEIAEEVDWGTA